MKLEQQLLINMEWSSNKTIDQQGMKLIKLLINRNEVRTTTIDQHGMKF